MLLIDLDLEFIYQNYVKGQTNADQLAYAPLPRDQSSKFDFRDESIATLSLGDIIYKMALLFNGSNYQHGGGVWVILIPLDGMHMPLSLKLKFECTYNMVKYESLVLGIQNSIGLDVKSINSFGDSQLVVNQVNGLYQCRNEELKNYKYHVNILLTTFDHFLIQTTP